MTASERSFTSGTARLLRSMAVASVLTSSLEAGGDAAEGFLRGGMVKASMRLLLLSRVNQRTAACSIYWRRERYERSVLVLR